MSDGIEFGIIPMMGGSLVSQVEVSSSFSAS